MKGVGGNRWIFPPLVSRTGTVIDAIGRKFGAVTDDFKNGASVRVLFSVFPLKLFVSLLMHYNALTTFCYQNEDQIIFSAAGMPVVPSSTIPAAPMSLTSCETQ